MHAPWAPPYLKSWLRHWFRCKCGPDAFTDTGTLISVYHTIALWIKCTLLTVNSSWICVSFLFQLLPCGKCHMSLIKNKLLISAEYLKCLLISRWCCMLLQVGRWYYNRNVQIVPSGCGTLVQSQVPEKLARAHVHLPASRILNNNSVFYGCNDVLPFR